MDSPSPMCGCEQDVIYSFPASVPASSYPCSPGHMGSTSHLANELGKVVGTITLLMDASCTVALPMSRMNDVQQT